MDKREKEYEVIITSTAERSYFQILDYVFEHYSELRANEIALELLEFPQSLKKYPFRGKIEELLLNRAYEYRFLLFERNNHTMVKIIYFIEESQHKVYITDFFPSEMNPKKIKKRS